MHIKLGLAEETLRGGRIRGALHNGAAVEVVQRTFDADGESSVPGLPNGPVWRLWLSCRRCLTCCLRGRNLNLWGDPALSDWALLGPDPDSSPVTR